VLASFGSLILWLALGSARAGSVTHTGGLDWGYASTYDNVYVYNDRIEIDDLVDEVDGWYRSSWTETRPLSAQASKDDATWFSVPDRCYPDSNHTYFRGPTWGDSRTGPHVDGSLGVDYVAAIPGGTRLELPAAVTTQRIGVLIGGSRIAQRDLTVRFYYTDGTNSQVVVPIPTIDILYDARDAVGVNYVRTGTNGFNATSNANWNADGIGGSDCVTGDDGGDLIEVTSPQPAKVIESIAFYYPDYDSNTASTGWLGGPLAVSLLDVNYDTLYTYRGRWASSLETNRAVYAGDNALFFSITGNASIQGGAEIYMNIACGDDIDHDHLLESNELSSIDTLKLDSNFTYDLDEPCVGRYLTYDVELVDPFSTFGSHPSLNNVTFHYDIDADGDGYGKDGLATVRDCNDANAQVFPGRIEIPGNGVDDDCTGYDVCYQDSDDDGARNEVLTMFTADMDCLDSGEGHPNDAIDCNDYDASISPTGTEIVGDDIDQDCDFHDSCFLDSDQDGHGSVTLREAAGYLCETGSSEARVSDDCDDTHADRFPGNLEVVGDAVDQDCDSHDLCYLDADDDSFGTWEMVVLAAGATCTGPGESTVGTDCIDWYDTVYPGAPELVGSGTDEDCDNREICYVDGDDDGARTMDTVVGALGDTHCYDPFEGEASDPLDCNDASVLIYPGAVETIASNVDEDCDGTELCYLDADGDGARTEDTVQTSPGELDCLDATEAMAADPLDCDDMNALVYPGAVEIPGDNVDEDCDQTELCYVDADEDGARTEDTLQTSPGDLDCLDATEGLTSDPVDCDDADPAIHPGAAELCNALDDDCNGMPDDGAGPVVSWYADTDGDTYGDPLTEVQGACSPDETWVTDDGDCDDSDTDIHPDAAEVCNGLDDDCQGGVDDLGEPITWYSDLDGDGVGGDEEMEADCPPGAGWAEVSGDCDDNDPKTTDTCLAGGGCGCSQIAPSPLAAWALLGMLLGLRGRRL
jgi:hypothetical protein